MSTDTAMWQPRQDYLIATVRAMETHRTVDTWRDDPAVPSITLTIQYRHLEMIWTPTTGWRVVALHPATGTPAGKALYLDAGPVPPPTVVAERMRAWRDGDIALTDMQPCYRPGDVSAALRDAVSGKPIQYRCPHCGEWEPVDGPADDDAYCVACGEHMPPHTSEARVTPADGDEARAALDGTEEARDERDAQAEETAQVGRRERYRVAEVTLLEDED